MNGSDLFEVGQRVRHRARPEWGEGIVHAAQPVVAGGRRAQRLTVTFTHHGRVTLNTAHAELETAMNSTPPTSSDPATPAASRAPGAPGGWLGKLESATGRSTEGTLTDLPEAATDPFASLSARLRATADLYRFSLEPRSLTDWAVAQTGLTDPLSQYNRHELEQQFKVFEQARYAHLRELLRAAKRSSEANVRATLQALQSHHNPTIRDAIQRAWRSL